MADSFVVWLTELLNSHNVDGDVFGEYISGSLDTMESCSEEELRETLVDTLAGCVEDQNTCEMLCKEIADRWLLKQEHQKIEELKTEGQSSSILSSIGSVPTPASRQPLSSTRTLASKAPGLSLSEKDKLLAQYDCVDDADAEETVTQMPAATASRKPPDLSDYGGLLENINHTSVVEEQSLLREKLKVAHEVKVEKDKQNRVTQKQKALDRKEKEKKRTQKQEKRR